MKNKFLSGLAVIGLAVTLVSCEKAPQAEIDQVKAAVDSARVAGAAIYQAESLSALEDSLSSILVEIEEESGKMLPSFDEIKTELEAVKSYAYQVVQQTETKKVEVSQEVETIVTEVKTLVEENKELVAKAPKGKEGKEALEQINTEIATIETSLGEIETLVGSGELIAAHEKVVVLKENATAINTELNTVMAKSGKI
jgi:hypothetical protein